MLHCLRPTTAAANPNLHPPSPSLQGNSNDGTPRSSSQISPTFNLSREYTSAAQTSSYAEIWSSFHPDNSSFQEVESEQLDGPEEEQLLAQVLHPNKECVEEALRFAKPNTLTCLVSAYFDQSEHTSCLCLQLHHGVQRAHSLYAPLHNLIAVPSYFDQSEHTSSVPPTPPWCPACPLSLCPSSPLTSYSLTGPFNIFPQYDRLENPFPHPDSHNYFNEMCNYISQLKQLLDSHLCKSRSRIRLLRRATAGCTICLIGTAVGVCHLCCSYCQPCTYRSCCQPRCIHCLEDDQESAGSFGTT